MTLAIERLELSTPFPVGPVNVYLLPGGTPTLVDSGMDFRDNREQLAQAIDETLGGHVTVLLLTHAHIDHIGLAGWVRQTYGCEVRIHPADRRMAEDYPGTQEFIARRYRDYFLGAGFPEPLYAQAEALMRSTSDFWRPLSVDSELRDGETVTAGNTDWRVSHHPGHSPGLVCLHERSGTLLASDLLIPDLTTIAFFEGDARWRGLGLNQHLASLERLQRIGPTRVGPGHRSWIDDPAAALSAQVDSIEQRLREVAGALGCIPRSPWEMVPELFGELPDDQGWLALSDLLGALELLESRGQAQPQVDDLGCRRYTSGV